jgi:hypothetical protein
MKKSLVFILLFCFVSQAFAQYNADNLQLKRGVKSKKIEAYSFDKLKLYPIYANDEFEKAHQDLGKYTSLKDALASKKIIITETENGNSTNTNLALGNTLQNNEDLITNNTRGETLEQTQRNNADTSLQRLREELVVQEEIQVQQINTNYQQNRNNIQQTQQRIGGNSATVNTLYIQNVSQDTVYLMAGEVVKGGKQDRVIAKDMVLPPGDNKVDLSVFCVEHGRWKYKGNESDSTSNNFSVSNYMVTQTVRAKAVLKSNQSEVWSEVANVNKNNNIKSSTGAYTALTKSKEYQKTTKKYQDHFKNSFKGQKEVIGVVAVTGKRVIGADMFASHELFTQQFPQLLSAYITDAMTYGNTVKISDVEVEKYLHKFLSDEGKQNNKMEKGKVFEYKDRKIHLSTY